MTVPSADMAPTEATNMAPAEATDVAPTEATVVPATAMGTPPTSVLASRAGTSEPEHWESDGSSLWGDTDDDL